METIAIKILMYVVAAIGHATASVPDIGWASILTALPFIIVFGMAWPNAAIAPQGFPGKAMFDRTQPGGEHAEDVSPLVEVLSPVTTPLLSALGMGNKPATNIKHEWLEDELIPDNDTLAAAVTAGAGTIQVTNPNAYQVGELIAMGTFPNIEMMQVTANPGTGILAVNRGYGSSVAMAHASGIEILLEGECSIEGDDAPDSQKTNMDRPFNITHIFNYALEMTGTRQALMPYTLGDIGDEWAYTRMKRMKEALRDLEAAVLASDWATAAGFQGSAFAPRSMRGILWYMMTGTVHGGAVRPPPANCMVNTAGAQFTFDNFRTMQQQAVYLNGAEEGEANLLVIPPALKVSVAKWKEAAQGTVTTNVNMSDNAVSQYVTTVMTDFGRVDVIMHSRLRKFGNLSILLSRKLVKPVNMVSRSFFEIPLGPTGDRKKSEIVGEYTLEMKGVDKGYHSVAYNWIPIP